MNQFDLTLYAVHAGWKHRGFCASGEYLPLALSEQIFQRPLPSPRISSSITDSSSSAGHSLRRQLSSSLVADRQSLGLMETGAELRGWRNWYINKNKNWKFTFDVARVDNSPANRIEPVSRPAKAAFWFARKCGRHFSQRVVFSYSGCPSAPRSDQPARGIRQTMIGRSVMLPLWPADRRTAAGDTRNRRSHAVSICMRVYRLRISVGVTKRFWVHAMQHA